MKTIWTLLLLALALVACSTTDQYAQLRSENRASIARIEKGMVREQVVKVMGSKSATGADETFTNPYKRELVRDRDGNEYEILYYYTERIGEKNWEEGVTPIILRMGVVVGVGWRYIESTDLSISLRRR
jgi:hypothetical protein